MANEKIRSEIKKSGFPKWQIASVVGIADTTFSKWLRKEMGEEKQVAIRTAIEKLAKGCSQ